MDKPADATDTDEITSRSRRLRLLASETITAEILLSLYLHR